MQEINLYREGISKAFHAHSVLNITPIWLVSWCPLIFQNVIQAFLTQMESEKDRFYRDSLRLLSLLCNDRYGSFPQCPAPPLHDVLLTTKTMFSCNYTDTQWQSCEISYCYSAPISFPTPIRLQPTLIWTHSETWCVFKLLHIWSLGRGSREQHQHIYVTTGAFGKNRHTSNSQRERDSQEWWKNDGGIIQCHAVYLLHLLFFILAVCLRGLCKGLCICIYCTHILHSGHIQCNGHDICIQLYSKIWTPQSS